MNNQIMKEEEIVLNGRPLKEYKLVELKEECKIRKLRLSGTKAVLIQRLSQAIEWENLQNSASEDNFQPNSSMATNNEDDFVKQYLESQRKMLNQYKSQRSEKSSESEDDQQHKRKSESRSLRSSDRTTSDRKLRDSSSKSFGHMTATSSVEAEQLKILKRIESEKSQDFESAETATTEVVKSTNQVVEKDEKQMMAGGEGENKNGKADEKELQNETFVDEPKEKAESEAENVETVKKEVSEETEKNVTKFEDEATANTKEVKDKELEATQKEEDKVPESTQKEEDKVSEAVQKEEDKVPEAAEKEEDKVLEATQKEEDKVSEATQKEEEKVPEAAQKEEDKVPESTQKEEDKVSEAAQKEEDKVPEAIEKIEDTVMEATEKVQDEVLTTLKNTENSSNDADQMDREDAGIKEESNVSVVIEDTKDKTDEDSPKKEKSQEDSIDDLHEKDADQKMGESVEDDHKADNIAPNKSGQGDQMKDVLIVNTDELMEVDEELDYNEDINAEKPENGKKEAEKNTCNEDDEADTKQAENNDKTESQVKSHSISLTNFTSRKINIKKTSNRASGSEPTKKERKRRWGRVTSDENQININTKSLKNLIEVKEGAINDESEDLEAIIAQEEEKEADVSEEEGEIVEEVIVEEIEEIERSVQVEEDGEEMEIEVGSEHEIEEVSDEDEIKSKSRNDSSSKDQSHVQENSNPNDPNFQDVEPTWIHVSNLVRPYALTQLKQLLCEHGPYIEKSFWVDNIKSHCFVQYESSKVAATTLKTLNDLQWPISSPKKLSVTFSNKNQLNLFKSGKLEPRKQPKVAERRTAREERRSTKEGLLPADGRRTESSRRVDEQRVEKRRRRSGSQEGEDASSRKVARTQRTIGRREWDLHKIDQDSKRRPPSPPRKELPRHKTQAAPEEPSKQLDDLFNKTKSTPSIYWLPLSEEASLERDAERERRREERAQKRKEAAEKEKKEMEKMREERMQARRDAEKRRKIEVDRRRRDDSRPRPSSRHDVSSRRDGEQMMSKPEEASRSGATRTKFHRNEKGQRKRKDSSSSSEDSSSSSGSSSSSSGSSSSSSSSDSDSSN